jgi:hypothetical protein
MNPNSNTSKLPLTNSEADDDNVDPAIHTTDQSRFVESSIVQKPTFGEAVKAITIWIQTVETTMEQVSVSASSVMEDLGNETKEDCNIETKEQSSQKYSTTMPLLQALRNELHAWKYCLQTCDALERCK